MSFQAKELSIADGKPVFLYEFLTGNSSYRINNSTQTVQHNGNDYLPAVVSHGMILASDGGGAKTQLDINLAPNNSFALEFLNSDQQQITTINVFERHFSDATSETLLAWKGEIVGIKPSDKKLTLSADSIINKFTRNANYSRFQLACRHAVYQTGCNLDKANFENPVTLVSVAGSTVQVEYPIDGQTQLPLQPYDGYFNSGLLQSPAGNVYHVVNHVGTSITVMDSAEKLGQELLATAPDALVVSLYPGCTKSRAICKSRFNNTLNFGGFPWMPGKNNNPFNGSPIGQ